jgi:hypothetical protein
MATPVKQKAKATRPKTAAALAPSALKANTPQALVLIWSMLTTHPLWTLSDKEITVPYDDIDKALNIQKGASKQVWDLARKTKTVAKTAQTFQNFILPPPGGDPSPTPLPPGWDGRECSLGQFVHLLNPSIDIVNFPDIVRKT